MRRETIEKCVVAYVLVACYALLPAIGYENGDTDRLLPHAAYMFCHANVWHLAGNLFVLWIMRGRLSLLPSLLIAFLASYLPAWSLYGDVGTTLGFSGVLFAMFGIKWGIYWHICNAQNRLAGRHALEQFLTRALPFALVGIAIPHLNWCIHLYSLVMGCLYGRFRVLPHT